MVKLIDGLPCTEGLEGSSDCNSKEQRIKAWRRQQKSHSGLLETFYEKCATFNIRHCSCRGSKGKGGMRSLRREVATAACCLAANAVVLSVVLARMLLSVCLALAESGRWIYGWLIGNAMRSEEELLSSVIGDMSRHDFRPPKRDKLH